MARNAPLAPAKIAEIREMIANGLGVCDTAELARVGRRTVAKHAGDLLAAQRTARRDARLARLRRIIKANESAASASDRDEIAARFGLKNRRVLSKTAVDAKHALNMHVRPTVRKKRGAAASPACIARIVSLAKCGFTCSEIVEKTGCRKQLVHDLARPHLTDGNAARALRAGERHREIAVVYDSAPRGERAALVDLFGVASLGSLKVLAHRGRRLLASEARA